MSKALNLISIAKILNFHGINGEVKVGYTKGKEEQLKAFKVMYISNKNVLMTLTVQSLRFHKGNALIKFKEFNSINDMEAYKGAFLRVPKSDVVSNLEEDEYLIEDLIGMSVYDQNDELIGVVKDVIDNLASHILEVKPCTELKTKNFLIPFVKDLVPEVDIKNKKILINNIEGLLE